MRSVRHQKGENMTDYQKILETARNTVPYIDDGKLKEIAYANILNHLLWVEKSERNIEKQRGITGRDVSWCVILLILGYAAILLPWQIIHLEQVQPVVPFLLALAAFSIAFAIHFSAVSATICGIYIREQGERRLKIRDIESKIVWSAHLALAGGLVIVVSSGLYLLKVTYFPIVYCIGAVVLLLGVGKYVFFERGWPWHIIEVLDKI